MTASKHTLEHCPKVGHGKSLPNQDLCLMCFLEVSCCRWEEYCKWRAENTQTGTLPVRFNTGGSPPRR